MLNFKPLQSSPTKNPIQKTTKTKTMTMKMTMRHSSSSSGLALGLSLTLCLTLLSSQVSVCHGFDLFSWYSLSASSPEPAGSSDPEAIELSGPSAAPAPAPAPSASTSGLREGFYKDLCANDVEAVIEMLVEEEFKKDPTILPALLRLQFHDCFVHGCDASILVDGESTEKTSGSNLSVRGYEFIEALKAALEEECPGVVSCADIIAVATQVVTKLGGGPDFAVQTGRRDGLISSVGDVNLPNPFMTVPEALKAFADKNFDAEDMVVLLGCHSVGITHCGFFQSRLYQDSPQFDPAMDLNLREQLMSTCPQGTTTNNSTLLNQDPTNKNTVDSTYYGQVKSNRAIFALDQALARDPETSPIVLELALNPALFHSKMASAMIKLQALDVLTGEEGEVRKVCSKLN